MLLLTAIKSRRGIYGRNRKSRTPPRDLIWRHAFAKVIFPLPTSRPS